MKSKAQEKREKAATSWMTNSINRILIDFKEKYLTSYVNWMESKILAKMASIPDDSRLNSLIGFELLGDHPELAAMAGVWLSKRNRDNKFTDFHISSIVSTRNKLLKKLSRASTNRLEWLNEANDSYNSKVEKLVTKLISNGFTEGIRFKDVSVAHNGELSFLVNLLDGSKECHARTIFANGDIKAPHYRFITTVRNLKK
jgi:hypothetical protein